MRPFQPRHALLAAAALCLGTTLPVQAESLGSAASSASSAGSASLGSLSDSIQGSSNSSSGKRNVAQGEYRVITVAEADRPGHVQLRLRPVAATADTDDVVLRVPRQALGEQGMDAGARVQVAQRPYGLAFARLDTAGVVAQPFFLALDDAWQRELAARPLTL